MEMEGHENSKRLRLNFKDTCILTKTQKKQGLKHSWLLIKPHHRTISDVVSHILDSYNLHQSCPRGIYLSMDGFVLPPFESTVILKDKDLVSVKRKGLGVKTITEARPFTEDEITEKQPLTSGVRLLANEEFNKEAGGYKSGSEADDVGAGEPVKSVGGGVASKKRKASSPVEILEKKRPRQVAPKSVQKKDTDHCENINSRQKKKKNDAGCKNEVSVKSTDNSEPRSESKELDEEKEATVCASGVPEVEKVSRNTRRKRRQRQWKKVGNNNNEENEKKHHSDADRNVVRVEIRPGHIRFAPASKAKDLQKGEEANGWKVKKKQENGWVQKNQVTNGWDVQSTQNSDWGDHSSQKNDWHSDKNKTGKETFCWNGITNKRKGQKWGKENQPSSWKQGRDYNGESSNSRSQPTSSWKQAKDHNIQSSSKWNSRQKQPNGCYVDFKKLMPLTDSPKVGDIVAYRLLELSSSWCPELSSFRVGKIASFDKETNKIMLVPEAEYPLNLGRKAVNDDDDDSGQPPQPANYNEDGSLEIDFPSLIDVRVVKTAIPGHSGGDGVPAANGTIGSLGMSSMNGPSDTGNQDLHTPINPANRKKDLWEEISETLSARKAQYRQEDSWNKESSKKRSWSQRTLNSRALDPNRMH